MPSQVLPLFGFNVDGICGIYCAIHRASLMCYVGSSVNIRKRFNEHLAKARGRGTTLFHRALREFGLDAFDFSVLEECVPSDLLRRERFYIALFDSASIDGLNTRENPTATYGIQPSAATGARISAAKKGMTFTPEQRARQSAGMIGLKPSRETCEKISASNRGKTFSVEHRAKISDARRGRKLTPEHKERLLSSLRGRTVSEESIAKQKATWQARKELMGVEFHDHRKPIIATAGGGHVIHVFESLLEAVAGLETANSSLRYYLRTGKITPKGMLLFYATIAKP